MLVHSFGVPADMTEIMKIAKKYGILVIEDAAPSLGAHHRGQKTGTFGDIGCFSFQGAKIAVSGEGGVLVTNNENHYRRAAYLAEMGRNDSVTRFWSDEIGYQYTIGNLTAALARAQVERIEELVAKKRMLFSWYDGRLGQHPRLTIVRERPGDKANYCYPSIFIRNISKAARDSIVQRLADLNVHARPAFPRMSTFPTLEERFPNPVATQVSNQGICLPAAANLDEDDVAFVCDALIECLDKIG
jgi:perosamine synthetase